MNDIAGRAIRVLLVDDDEDDYVLIDRIFSKIPDSPFELDWSDSFERAKELVLTDDYDLFLIDYRLGAHTGLELLELAEASQRTEPFILLTGTGDAHIELQSMQLAAADYLVKGALKPDMLARALYYALGRKQIEAQRIQHYIELNKTKDEFISLASHQLRTPATGVKQYVGMVLEGMAGEINEAQQKLLEKAYESNERQLLTISDLLKVAQVDAGKVHIKPKPVDMVELLADIIKEQKNTYKSREQTLKFNTLSFDSTAYVDPAKMRMVFENLIDNASKYSGKGKTVYVAVCEEDGMVRIDVKDTGVGIPESEMQRLFQKFSRIHNNLSDHVGGSGLGLYWAKKIIDLHDGIIKVTSVPNKGTTFSVLVPKKGIEV